MKHYSGVAFVPGPSAPSGAGMIPRLALRGEALGEAELIAELHRRLLAADDRHALAREIKVTPFKLVGVLRGRWPIDDDLAARLGYRRITRFEKIS